MGIKVGPGGGVAALQAAGAAPTLIRGRKTFTGAANLGATGVNELFTTTGAVVLDGFWVRCTTGLVDAVDGALFALGVTGDANCFWDGTDDGDLTDLDSIVAGHLLWFQDGAAGLGDGIGRANSISEPPDRGAAIVDNIIMTISAQAITGGALDFYVLFRPLSSDGALALGAGMTAI